MRCARFGFCVGIDGKVPRCNTSSQCPAQAELEAKAGDGDVSLVHDKLEKAIQVPCEKHRAGMSFANVLLRTI